MKKEVRSEAVGGLLEPWSAEIFPYERKMKKAVGHRLKYYNRNTNQNLEI